MTPDLVIAGPVIASTWKSTYPKQSTQLIMLRSAEGFSPGISSLICIKLGGYTGGDELSSKEDILERRPKRFLALVTVKPNFGRIFVFPRAFAPIENHHLSSHVTSQSKAPIENHVTSQLKAPI